MQKFFKDTVKEKLAGEDLLQSNQNHIMVFNAFFTIAATSAMGLITEQGELHLKLRGRHIRFGIQ